MRHDRIVAPHGTHLIAGAWIATEVQFRNGPVSGPVHFFSVGAADLVNRAAESAEEAFRSCDHSLREDRAAFFGAIADEIEARAEAVTEIGTRETGLPAARLLGERGRTTGQLRLFASPIRQRDCLGRRRDPALPTASPRPARKSGWCGARSDRSPSSATPVSRWPPPPPVATPPPREPPVARD